MSTAITSDPAILGGKPCIRGTRISVEFILELMASGATPAQIAATYPQLSKDDVEGALRYAAMHLRHDTLLEFEISG